MIAFLLYTLVAILANACLVKILHVSIQPGQWLDKLLNWQNKLQRWDMEGKTFRAKAGGYCELCFSHIISFAGYWAYAFFMNAALHVWVTAQVDSIWAWVGINLVWYLVYVGIATNAGLYFITKLFQHEDGH